jgi:predicted HAD superfamily phosphohydrolase
MLEPRARLIDEELAAQLCSSIASVVATRDASLAPEITRAWGPRVLADGRTLLIAVDRIRSAKALQNLRENGVLAVTFVRNDYRAVQLKGWCSEIADEDAEGLKAVEEHHHRYAAGLMQYGVPGHISRNHWSWDVVRLRCEIDAVFDQTPGPAAGKPR